MGNWGWGRVSFFFFSPRNFNFFILFYFYYLGYLLKQGKLVLFDLILVNFAKFQPIVLISAELERG